jgi:hypothetical protein
MSKTAASAEQHADAENDAANAKGETVTLKAGDLLNENEVAEILKTAVRTLRNWRGLGKGPPYVKIGERIVRYPRRGVAKFAGLG